MAKRKRSPGGSVHPEGSTKPRAPLAVFLYLCGDNHIARYTKKYLQGVFAALPTTATHWVIQHDTPKGAQRFLVKAGEKRQKQEKSVRADINTGDPRVLEEFLQWALRSVTADHHILILSGLGINPRYVRQSLPLESLPQAIREVRGGKPGDPSERRFSARYQRAVQELSSADVHRYRDAIHQKLFSLCHDFSNSGSLGVSELRQVLLKTARSFDASKADPRFDLVLIDAGATAFVEVLFELEGLAKTFVGSRALIPDSGLPYKEIARAWDTEAKSALVDHSENENSGPLSHRLAKSVLRIATESFRKQGHQADDLVAVNLETLDEVARSLDALATALLHSIGDWHVWDALNQAGKEVREAYVDTAEPDSRRIRRRRSIPARSPAELSILEQVEFLPAVDLFRLLDVLEKFLHEKLTHGQVPVQYGQYRRTQKLYRLLRKMIAHLDSPNLLPTDDGEGTLFFSLPRMKRSNKGLSILLPPVRTQREVQEETGKIFSLSIPSYANLHFSKRVHWSALIGALQMIRERPHALWRVIGSMLADTSSPARDAALSRLISRQSVVASLSQQFQSLGESVSLTLSLDPLGTMGVPEAVGLDEVERIEVRLKPSLGGAAIRRFESRIYRSSLEATLRDLHLLLHSSDPVERLYEKLRGLGASLGEDVIQDLAGAIDDERSSLALQREETPHLMLEIPRAWMRYPWELMFDGQATFGERFAIARQVFMETQFVQPVSRRSTDKIKILVIGDPEYTPDFLRSLMEKGIHPQRLPSAALEATTIAQSFERLNDEMAGVIELQVQKNIQHRVTINDMRTALREGSFDIIHFAGHAYFNPRDTDGSAWILSDGLLHAREMRNTLSRSKRRPWLIFANACEAGMDQYQPAAQARVNVSDVTGLATACINQGVAAYIAPLWPVDDEIARWMAVHFYRELVRERFSVGESLRRARVAIWQDLLASGATQTMPAKTALTWSSFVLYGDPTARLLQAMWTPGADREKSQGTKQDRQANAAPSASRRWKVATLRQLAERIDFPSNLLADGSQNRTSLERNTPSTSQLTSDTLQIELVEEGGLRYWRSWSAGEGGAKTRSELGRLLSDPDPTSSEASLRQRIRSITGHDRGILDYAVVVKSWLVKKLTGVEQQTLIQQLVAEFDRQQVPQELLYRISSQSERRVVCHLPQRKTRDLDRGLWLNRHAVSGQFNRVLLLIHGTFSSGQSAFGDLSKEGNFEQETILDWMLRRYRAVLSFDHWTLSRTPEQNAEKLLELLPKSWSTPEGEKRPLELDIVCHSRGGLVARAFVELLRHQHRVRRVVFVGVPQAGTRLANPALWGTMADVLVNLVAEDPTGLLGRLSGLLFYLAAQDVTQQVPGLQAMNPLTWDDPSGRSLLARLRDSIADSSKYFVVASNYTPERDSLSIFSLLQELGNGILDRFFDCPNDLVVDTPSMWSIGGNLGYSQQVPEAFEGRVLLLNAQGDGPKNVEPRTQAGVHHVNYFQQPAVRDFIRQSLDRDD